MPVSRRTLGGAPTPQRRGTTPPGPDSDAAAMAGGEGASPVPTPAQPAAPVRPSLPALGSSITGGDTDVMNMAIQGETGVEPPEVTGQAAELATAPGTSQGLTRPTRTTPEQDETGIGDSGPDSILPFERQVGSLDRATTPLEGEDPDGDVQAILRQIMQQRGGTGLQGR